MTLSTLAKISGIFMVTMVAWGSLDAIWTAFLHSETADPAVPAFSIVSTGR